MYEDALKNRDVVRRILNDLALKASAKVGILVREGEVPGAVQVMEDIREEYNEIIDSVRTNPARLPVQYANLDDQCRDLLLGLGYSTMGDLLKDWPVAILSKQGIDVGYHQMIHDALAELCLTATFSDDL
jgi:hypothetical protein